MSDALAPSPAESPPPLTDADDAMAGDTEYAGGLWRTVVRRFRGDFVAMTALGFLVLLVGLVIFAHQVAGDPDKQDLFNRFRPLFDSWAHPLGTDGFGRDVLDRLIFGARTSLLASVEGLGISLALGVPFGLLAGYFGGWVNLVFSRVSDSLMSVPPLVLALVIVAVLGNSLGNAMLGIGIVIAPRFYRIARASTQDVRHETYIEASRAIGCRPTRIILRHVFPNMVSPIIVQSSLVLGFVIIAEASLAYLGVGVQLPKASWGSMILTAAQGIYTQRWAILPPGFIVMLTVLAFSVCGDTLRDALGTGKRSGEV